MAKRGLHIPSRPKLSSSAGLFEKRGDKWGGSRKTPANPKPPTALEQAADEALKKIGSSYGTAAEISERLRQANADDPELDQFTRARKASLRAPYVDPVPSGNTKDEQRKATSRLLKMQGKLRPNVVSAVSNSRTKTEAPLSVTDKKVMAKRGDLDEVRIDALMDEGLSREKARQQVVREREEEARRRADYAARKFGRGGND
jgi:hypothetical protein